MNECVTGADMEAYAQPSHSSRRAGEFDVFSLSDIEISELQCL